MVCKSMLNYLKERTKYQQARLVLEVFIVIDFIFCIKTSTKNGFITVFLFPSTHISSKLSLKKLKIGGVEQLDNLICDTISTLRSNKKQLNENKNLKANHTTERALTIQKQIEPICPLLSKPFSNKDHRQPRLKEPKVPCLLAKLFYHQNRLLLQY